MDADAAARHSSRLLAILSVAPPRLMNGASHAPLTNHADLTQCGLAEWCYFSMQPEREVDPPSRMRHQKAYCVCRQIHAQTAANHHVVPIGVCASAPDVRQGALGGRRARLDGVNSCFGSGEPSFASLCKVATLRPRPGFFWPQWVHPA